MCGSGSCDVAGMASWNVEKRTTAGVVGQCGMQSPVRGMWVWWVILRVREGAGGTFQDGGGGAGGMNGWGRCIECGWGGGGGGGSGMIV